MSEVRFIAGGGQFEWVWLAIASGDAQALRAAPAAFDVAGTHPRYGSVLTAFLQGLLNLEGNFIAEGDRRSRAKELVNELARRGARPDQVIPCANMTIRGLYRSWRLTGDITPMQVVIQIRNDLTKWTFEHEEEDVTVEESIKAAADLITKFSEMIAGGCREVPRTSIPDAVLAIWERFLEDATSADVEIITPEGAVAAHAAVLSAASPVLGAMLASGMREGTRREVRVDDPLAAVELFRSLLYTGCVPAPDQAQPGDSGPQLRLGARVVVDSPLMSNSARSVLLPMCISGEVARLDEKGDALIQFEDVPARQWVTKKNFWRLRLADAPRSSAATQEALVGAFLLTKRWQVSGLSEVLEERLERGLTAEGFGAVAEAAELHGVTRLRAVCLAFAQSSPLVRAAFDAGSYPQLVLDLLSAAYGAERPQKRARQAI